MNKKITNFFKIFIIFHSGFISNASLLMDVVILVNLLFIHARIVLSIKKLEIMIPET